MFARLASSSQLALIVTPILQVHKEKRHTLTMARPLEFGHENEKNRMNRLFFRFHLSLSVLPRPQVVL